jgi:DNA polymerase-4
VVSACSYEARAFGIHSGLSTAVALKKCPAARMVRPRMERYKAVSGTLMQLFSQLTDQMEPLAFDEAYLDVSERCSTWEEARQLASALKRTVTEQTQLTCSVGVSFNKFLAKLASGRQKPDGLTVFTPDNYQDYIAQTPVAKFYGIGQVTLQQLQQRGIHTGQDLLALDEETLVRLFRRRGRVLYNHVRGLDERPVDTNRPRRSLGREFTFAHDVMPHSEALDAALHQLATALSERLVANGTGAQRIVVKVKFADFSEKSKRISLPRPTNHAAIIEEKARLLFQSLVPATGQLRKVAIYALDFGPPLPLVPLEAQLRLF